MEKSKAKRLLQVGVGLVLVATLIYFVDVKQTAALLRGANYLYFLAGLLVTVAGRILMSFKWGLLLRAKGIRLPQLEVLRVYYISNFLGYFLPATVGMDVVRAMFIKRRDNSYPDIVSSIFVERLLGMVVLAFFSIIGSVTLARILLTEEFSFVRVEGLAIALIAGALVSILVSFSARFKIGIDRLLTRLSRVQRIGTVVRHLHATFESYYEYRHHRVTLLVFCLLTALEVGTLVLWNYCAGLALGVDVSFLHFMCFIPIVTLLVRLPITIGGFGIQEGAFVFFLTLLGATKEQGLAVGIVAHAIAIAALVPGGILYAFAHRYREEYASGMEELPGDPTVRGTTSITCSSRTDTDSSSRRTG